MAERSIASDCKSDAFGLRRFESCSQHRLIFAGAKRVAKIGTPRSLRRGARNKTPVFTIGVLLFVDVRQDSNGKGVGKTACPGIAGREVFPWRKRRNPSILRLGRSADGFQKILPSQSFVYLTLASGATDKNGTLRHYFSDKKSGILFRNPRIRWATRS